MLAPTFGRDSCDGPFENLEQRLLHAFARDVSRNGSVVGLARDLVDFVDVDDATFGTLDVEVRRVQQMRKDAFYVFADVSGFGQGRCVGYREGHVEDPRERSGEEGLAGARRANQEDVRLLEFDIFVVVHVVVRVDALVVIVDGNGERLLCTRLADDVFVEGGFNFAGRQPLVARPGALARRGTCRRAGGRLKGSDVRSHDARRVVDAAVADVHLRTRDHRSHFVGG